MLRIRIGNLCQLDEDARSIARMKEGLFPEVVVQADVDGFVTLRSQLLDGDREIGNVQSYVVQAFATSGQEAIKEPFAVQRLYNFDLAAGELELQPPKAVVRLIGSVDELGSQNFGKQAGRTRRIPCCHRDVI